MKKNLYLLFTVFLYFWVQMEQRFVCGGVNMRGIYTFLVINIAD